MATRNNGKSIKMFYLSTNLPGKYQWLTRLSTETGEAILGLLCQFHQAFKSDVLLNQL